VHLPSPSAPAGVPLLLAAGVLWGTGGLLGTLLAAATGLSPLGVAGYRLLTGGGLLLAGLLVLRHPGLRRLGLRRSGLRRSGLRRSGLRRFDPGGRAARRRTAVTALLAAVFQAGYFAAVALTSVALATLVTIGATPLLVVLAERLRGRPGSRRTSAACGLAVVGLGLLVGVPGPTGTPLAGVAFALLAAAGFAVMTVLAAQPVPGLDDATTTAVAFTLGGTLLLVVAVPVTGIAFTPGPAALGLLTALAVLPTALAYTLFFRGLRRASPATGAVAALLEPLTGALLAALVLGERLGPAGLVGAGAVGAAVLLASLPARARQPVP
jgi:DME family drug/metabolite transporter